MSDTPRISIPDMCDKHQSLLVHQAGYTENDPWRALIIVSQVALFQAATCDKKTYKQLEGEITGIEKLGCLACYKPDAFGEIVEAAKSRNLKEIKALGERWIRESLSQPRFKCRLDEQQCRESHCDKATCRYNELRTPAPSQDGEL